MKLQMCQSVNISFVLSHKNPNILFPRRKTNIKNFKLCVLSMIIKSKNSSHSFSSILFFFFIELHRNNFPSYKTKKKQKIEILILWSSPWFFINPAQSAAEVPPPLFRATVTNPVTSLFLVRRTTFFPFREKFFQARFRGVTKTRRGKKKWEGNGVKRRKGTSRINCCDRSADN